MPGNTRKKGEVAEKGGTPKTEVAGIESMCPCVCRSKTKGGAKNSQIKIYYPLLASPTPPQPTTGQTLPYFSKTERLLFLLINHPAHPIRRSGSNQRELLVSPDSPSPRASLATLLFLVDHGGEAQRQSRRNAGGVKSGW